METPDIIYLSPYKQGEGQDYIGLAWTHPSEFCNHVPYVRRDLIDGMIRDMKELIRAEIERMHQQSVIAAVGNETDWLRSRIGTLVDVMDFLHTLEAETSYDTLQYNPSPSVDIGDVARVQFASHAKVFDKKRKAVFDWEQFKEVAGIFYGFGQRNNTLSEEPVSDCNDLEEAKEEYLCKARRTPGHEWMTRDIEDAFKAGAEWQEKQDLGWAGEIHKNGYNLFKEQMMKGAVEGEVCGRVYDHINVRFADGVCKYLEPKNISHIPADVSKYNIGDKVKIIIVKEEEQ